jgi:hypothetical protein
MSKGVLGCMITPGQGNKLPPPPVAFAIDNGCGPGKNGIGAGYPGDREFRWFLMHMSSQARERCLFAVAPDAVCDAKATVERLHRFYAMMRGKWGLPVALAAQNGLEDMDVPWHEFDVLFLGGDDAWKLGPAARDLVTEAKQRHKRVHMGRVNSKKRAEYAEAIGCDTVDGTHLTFGPDKNLPIVLGWDRRVNEQPELWDDGSRLPEPSPDAVLQPLLIHPEARRRSTGRTVPAYSVRRDHPRGAARRLAVFTHPSDRCRAGLSSMMFGVNRERRRWWIRARCRTAGGC